MKGKRIPKSRPRRQPRRDDAEPVSASFIDSCAHMELPSLAIVGRPNVGKSSLFNAILGRRQAIVHFDCGVTRDRVSASGVWHGRRFNLIDTGGLGMFENETNSVGKWDKLIALRGDVNVVLESARNDKRIGKPLEAAVTLRADDPESAELLDAVSDMDLSDLLIVSRCLTEDDGPEDAVVGQGSRSPGLRISVSEAPGTKCPRCWRHSLEADPVTELCPRCAAVVAKL